MQKIGPSSSSRLKRSTRAWRLTARFFSEPAAKGRAKVVGAAPQAVGQACGANPLPILIPCHRVTGTDWFGGFSAPGGVETKAALLRHEGALLL